MGLGSMVPRILGLALALLLCFAPIVSAFEKVSSRLVADRGGESEWSTAATTASIVYYNTCTGWAWIWGGWQSGDQFGVQFDSPCYSGTTLLSSFIYFMTGAPSGYGLTGQIDVRAADGAHCPTGPSLAGQPLLPASGWNQIEFNPPVIVPPLFAVSYTVASDSDPMAIASDHPDQGPKGPPACGTCYPTNRMGHSFYWGTLSSPLCPGSTLYDGVCDAELLWDVQLACFKGPVSVEDASWGAIKALYR